MVRKVISLVGLAVASGLDFPTPECDPAIESCEVEAQKVSLLQGGLRSKVKQHRSKEDPKDDDCFTTSICDQIRCSNEQWKCHKDVKWARSTGIHQHPEVYGSCNGDSPYECFQDVLHETVASSPCPKACPYTTTTTSTTTTTTTTTTPPEGTPPCPDAKPWPDFPENATDYNGIEWPGMCFVGNEEEHVFIIGDWGGLQHGSHVKPAPNNKGKRDFAYGIDDKAGYMVATQFNRYAEKFKPRYVLNAGDNFYWAGVTELCGKPMNQSVKEFWNPKSHNSAQFYGIFENMYKGPGIDNVPWINTLGNHDYGGFQFNHAWDQQIAYTWGPQHRWILPGQYFQVPITYPTKNMSVDVYAVDTCNQDTTHPDKDPGHNICSAMHNGGANCAPFGPTNAWDCVEWFKALWQKQLVWLDERLAKSTADWQIIVTHFPPETWTHYGKNVEDWRKLGDDYGIDLIVAAHRHDQELRGSGDPMVRDRAHIPYVVTGGGGGVTSEGFPSNYGRGDNQYGFFDMVVTKDQLRIQGYNQVGTPKLRMNVAKRYKRCSDWEGNVSTSYPCGCAKFTCYEGQVCFNAMHPWKHYWQNFCKDAPKDDDSAPSRSDSMSPPPILDDADENEVMPPPNPNYQDATQDNDETGIMEEVPSYLQVPSTASRCDFESSEGCEEQEEEQDELQRRRQEALQELQRIDNALVEEEVKEQAANSDGVEAFA